MLRSPHAVVSPAVRCASYTADPPSSYASIVGRHCASFRRTTLSPSSSSGIRRAAVLVPLVTTQQGPSLLFTIRAPTLRSHSGQVSFPGGHLEPGETPTEAALREAHEELGVDPTAVLPLCLHDDGIVRGVWVTPVLAELQGDFSEQGLQRLVLAPEEVSSVFTLSIAHLSAPENVTHELLSPRSGTLVDDGDPPPGGYSGGGLVRVPAFHGGPARIWGFTAWLVQRLLETVLVPAQHEWDLGGRRPTGGGGGGGAPGRRGGGGDS